MARIDYFNDPNAPKANSIVPAASAIVSNAEGKILLERRSDNARWGLPSGVMEIGERISETVVREVKEETGLDVRVDYIVGIYTNPHHVIAFSDGEVRQQFSLCFACTLLGGEIQVSSESLEVGFFSPEEIEQLNIHPSLSLRIRHYLERRSQPAIC
jgi:ADP-ribose pyrophosphatase YjhB (NUDIX family)